jgi:hypothetical protein
MGAESDSKPSLGRSPRRSLFQARKRTSVAAKKPIRFPRYVGPHNDHELELMLAGRKPLARFVKELSVPGHKLGDEAFASVVDSGKISKIFIQDGQVEYRYYCLPTEEWRIKLLEFVRKADTGIFTDDDLHRLDGALLGYAKADVEKFVNRARRIRSGKG